MDNADTKCLPQLLAILYYWERCDDIVNADNTVQVWILSRLFQNDDMGFRRRDLMREICSKSIETMEKPEDLQDALERLEKDGLIEPIAENTYEITEKGLFIYRKEIVGAIQKKYFGLLNKIEMPSYFSKYKDIVEALNATGELAKNIARLGILNAPLIVEFLKDASL